MGVVRKGITKGMTGRIGDTSYYNNGAETIVRESTSSQSNPQSTAQMTRRVSLAPLVSFWRSTSGTLAKAFQGKRPGTSDYNNFVGWNFNGSHGYMMKEEVEAGVSYISDFFITHGSLPSIGVKHIESEYVSSIALGSTALDEENTVAEWSKAIMENNLDFKEGDCIIRFGFDYSDLDGDGHKRVITSYGKLRLSLIDNRTMDEVGLGEWFMLTDTQFSERSTYWLAGWSPQAGKGSCLVHTRKTKKGLQVSSQRIMESSNTYGAEHKTAMARRLAIFSYTKFEPVL